MKLGDWPKFQKLHIYSQPQGAKIELISALQAAVSQIQADFQNCVIWAWNLVSGETFISCIFTLFVPQGVEIELIFALRAAVSEILANFQNCHIWACNLASGQIPEVAHIPSFYPRELKLTLFLLYGQRFPRYGPIFKIAIFGHETWPLAKVPEVAHNSILPFYPRESKLSLFLLYGPQLRR